ncbi:hypothetical protein IMG5_115220 [Ichthyophthirius multifiliis]|uniref:Peptidase A1 domain-containing protein n=1 Tax=Ichthyophthirius multifiliis TaxID=5932 RepID=G0QU70_ICHMU|nr:hypothetical protein IMG5_115220 [Ichthyophthirius multifiliis]EGR31236.1 hypothetical protein IMG5_115220 [Ichthyophthirius multifiliis]|eukprot:XP_004034722.1 hypothetical protein IMG5_115220 [Ichthyophthirius multifiliis]
MQIKIFFLFVFLIQFLCYEELSLIRNQQQYKINIYQVISNKQLSEYIKKNPCPQDILQFSHNTTISTQLCYFKDLSYNIEVLIGDINFNYQIAALALDLNSPWTWIKSHQCTHCIQQKEEQKCFQNCLFDQSQTDFVVTNAYRKNKKAQISSNIQSVYGEYIESNFSFMSYEPEKNKSLFRYFEEYLLEDEYQKYQDITTLPNFKLVAVSKMVNYQNFTADGAIALGVSNVQKEQKKIEPNTDFLQALINVTDDDEDQNSFEKKNKKVFGIYINEIGYYFPDYALTIGGINYKYSHKKVQNAHFVPLNDESQYYWALPLKSMEIIQSESDWNNQQVNNNSIFFAKKQAIITLSTSLIALPLQEFISFVKILSRISKANCKVVDQNLYVVYCRQFDINLVHKGILAINFDNDVQLKLNFLELIKECSLDTSENENFELQDCIFNVQLSQTNNVILGEPFLKKHYTIFDSDNKQVGFLPAADNTFWKEEFYQTPSFIKLALYLYFQLNYYCIINQIFIENCCLCIYFWNAFNCFYVLNQQILCVDKIKILQRQQSKRRIIIKKNKLRRYFLLRSGTRNEKKGFG